MIDTRSMHAGKMSAIYVARQRLLEAARGIRAYVPGLTEAERVLIPDISHYNGVVDFMRMRDAGASGFYQKATESTYNWVDPTYEPRRKAADAINFPFGLYAFLRYASGVQQADVFIAKTAAGRGVLPSVVDVEVAMPAYVVRTYAERIKERLGYYPIIYTSHYCWSLVSGTTAEKTWLSANCPLWVAHWGATNPLCPPGWTSYMLWQYSANGNKRGAEFGCTGGDPDLDLNHARRSWFEKYVKPAPAPLTLEQRVARIEAHLGIA